MAGFKKSSWAQEKTYYKSMYINPLNKINRSSNGSEQFSGLRHPLCPRSVSAEGKENALPCESSCSCSSSIVEKSTERKPLSCMTNKKVTLKPSSLELCMQWDDSTQVTKAANRDSLKVEEYDSRNLWDYSDSEAAPASSWSTLPNRCLLYRPLPLDIGRCTCVIKKEVSEELGGISVYTLYTNEGPGRQDRKLAIAHYRRHNGRTEFIIAQDTKGILCNSDESFLGSIKANLMGSKYKILNQGIQSDRIRRQPNLLLGVVVFAPTITTLTGSYRGLKAWVAKCQSMQLKNSSTIQIQHVNGLPKEWKEEKRYKAQELCSKVPSYNHVSRRYELDFRDKGRSGLRIRSSIKNFQLAMEENGKQIILQLGRIEKSKYVMDYRYPLTGFQAFCICLSSIDSKLCCFV